MSKALGNFIVAFILVVLVSVCFLGLILLSMMVGYGLEQITTDTGGWTTGIAAVIFAVAVLIGIAAAIGSFNE